MLRKNWRDLYRLAVFFSFLTCIAATAQNAATGSGATASSGKERAVRQTPRAAAAKSAPRQQAFSAAAAAAPTGGPAVTFLGSVPTASAAESFALNGNLAYVCDDNEITIVDVTNPVNPQVVGTATSTLIRNSADIHCAIQRSSLVVFGDQPATTVSGPGPGVSAFNLTNPLQPQLIGATSLNRRFFQDPVYIGNTAFVPTAAVDFFFGSWNNQYGDLLAVDLSDFTNPRLGPPLEQPQISATLGGPTPVLGAAQADSALIYLGGTTSTSNQNNGVGILRLVDVSNPSAMQLIAQLTIPSSIHFDVPQIQATVAVGIGNTGGYVGALNAVPGEKGNIVVATFDVTDRRSPVLLSSTVTAYSVGQGSGATRIGANLFAFAGVVDSANNPVLLVVDITNPQSPVIQSIAIPQPFTSMQAAGSTLYATLGSGGFATYSIPGGASPSITCPASMDALIVFDRGAAVPAQAFANARVSMKSFIDALHLKPDQAGVVSFGASALLAQPLTINGPLAKNAIDAIAAGGPSYIGAGIAAAQAELTGPRHGASATPLMIVVSDGGDQGAPYPGATLAAANAAKAAGIRIISLQYGPGTSALMQSIASSGSDYYVVPNP